PDNPEHMVDAEIGIQRAEAERQNNKRVLNAVLRYDVSRTEFWGGKMDVYKNVVELFSLAGEYAQSFKPHLTREGAEAPKNVLEHVRNQLQNKLSELMNDKAAEH